jgi:hypothetical protein
VFVVGDCVDEIFIVITPLQSEPGVIGRSVVVVLCVAVAVVIGRVAVVVVVITRFVIVES